MSLLDQDITILRASTGDYVDGLYQTGDRVQLTVKGCITTKNQMALYKQLNYDIELKASDIEGLISVITATDKLKTIKIDGLEKADIVVYNESMYQVLSETGLQKLGNTQHYRYIAKYIETLDDGINEPVSGNPFKAGRVDVYKDSELVANRPNLNFISSDTISLNISDNNVTDSVDIIIDTNASNNFIEIEFNEDIEKLKVVTVDGFKANSNDVILHNKILGINKAYTLQNHVGQVYHSGELFDLDISYPIGTNLFLNGDSISPIAPTTGFIQSLGKIIKANTILIDIQESYIL